MGTSNFHSVNASAVFAFTPSDDEYPFYYEDIKDEVESALKERGLCTDRKWADDPYELRSYPSSVLGHKTVERTFMGAWFAVTIKAVIRSGYYDGACLDWFTQVDTEARGFLDRGYDDEWDHFLDRLLDSSENVGFAKANLPRLMRWIDHTRDELIKECEQVFKEMTTPLSAVATFSNGETLYAQKS